MDIIDLSDKYGISLIDVQKNMSPSVLLLQ